MEDFEVHPRGTSRELFLARHLTNSIEQLINQYGDGIIPESIRKPYQMLKDEYMRQLNEEARR